ncbi:unnamed protein product, partial [Mesorhabditis spiculigera]
MKTARRPSAVSTSSCTALYEGFKLVAPNCPIYAKHQLMPSKIFVGGFAPDVDESELGQVLLMATQTEIREVRIVRDQDTGASKGFGFVTFNDVASADAARNLPPEKLVLKGRQLKVGVAYRKFPHQIRPQDYNIITPDGEEKPSRGFHYIFPTSAPYALLGLPQPTAFAMPVSSANYHPEAPVVSPNTQTSQNYDFSSGPVTPRSAQSTPSADSNDMQPLVPHGSPVMGHAYYNMPTTPIGATAPLLYQNYYHLTPPGHDTGPYPRDGNYNFQPMMSQLAYLAQQQAAYGGSSSNTGFVQGDGRHEGHYSRDSNAQKSSSSGNRLKSQRKYNNKPGMGMTPPSTPKDQPPKRDKHYQQQH